MAMNAFMKFFYKFLINALPVLTCQIFSDLPLRSDRHFLEIFYRQKQYMFINSAF